MSNSSATPRPQPDVPTTAPSAPVRRDSENIVPAWAKVASAGLLAVVAGCRAPDPTSRPETPTVQAAPIHESALTPVDRSDGPDGIGVRPIDPELTTLLATSSFEDLRSLRELNEVEVSQAVGQELLRRNKLTLDTELPAVVLDDGNIGVIGVHISYIFKADGTWEKIENQ